MTISIWIDNESHGLKLGAAGYLVETLNTNTGKARWSVRERPLRAKGTGEPRLTGECEKSGNHVRTAHGVVLVVQVNGAESRVRIMSLHGERLAEFLRSDGFPELIPADQAVAAGGA
jgi:hypothetical protein